MVGRLLSLWDGKKFRGYIEHRGCMIKAPKAINGPWGLKDFALVGPLQFPGAFCCWAAAGFWKDPEMMELELILLLNSRGFTNWYLKVCVCFSYSNCNHNLVKITMENWQAYFFQLAQPPNWSSPLQLEPVGSIVGCFSPSKQLQEFTHIKKGKKTTDLFYNLRRTGASIVKIISKFNQVTWVFPKIGGNPPKWMVKIMENHNMEIHDLGGFSHIFWLTPT